MKKVICLLTSLVLLLCGCEQIPQIEKNLVFTKTEGTKLISSSGVEYIHLAFEGQLWYFGELEHVGVVQGEDEYWEYAVGFPIKTGLFAVKGQGDDVLIRQAPNDEWTHVYRKSALPALDFSVDNCSRLEFIPGSQMLLNHEDATHTTCKGGISNKKEIARFWSEVRSQENPRDAGLYDFVEKPDGWFENYYLYGMIFAFFKEEPNLAAPVQVWSYNDQGYSVKFVGEESALEYVLPESWLQKLQDSVCTP